MKYFTGFLFLLFSTNLLNAQLSVQHVNGGILVAEDGADVLFYRIVPKSYNGKYARCNYIHPLWGLDGNVLTEDFPPDHLHQRGIFWAWHQILIDGKSVGDGWAIEDFEQEVTDTWLELQKSGSAVFKTRVSWKSDKWKKNGVKVPYLEEQATVTIHPRKKNYRKIDFEISLLALTGNLQIGGADNEKGYSGFSARIILPEDVQFSGPDGNIIPKNLAVQSAGFVNIAGAFAQNGGKAGMVIVDNPQNPMYPQMWILRKAKSMQNPLFPGRVPVDVSSKVPLVLKYSLVVYSGELSNEEIGEIIK